MGWYPDYIFKVTGPSVPPNENDATVVDKSYVDSRDGEITAIEQALGVNLAPAGGDVTKSLAALLRANASGYLVVGRQSPSEPKVSIGDPPAGGPLANLDIWHGDPNNLQDRSIRVSNYQRGLMIQAQGTGWRPTVQSLGSENLEFQAGNGNAGNYLFTSTGKMGAGTADPKFTLHVNGRLAYSVPTSAPIDADLPMSSVTAYLQEGSPNLLTFRVRLSTGGYKTGTSTLS